jgi:alpha-galactosidase
LTTNRFDMVYSPTPIKLKGLNPTKNYRVTEINIFPGTSTTLNADLVYSGDYLMNVGVNPDMGLKRTSVVLEITEVK